MANGVGNLTFTQVATILNSIHAQVTGTTSITNVTTTNFVAVAQTTLKSGYEPVLSAISQVLSRTIFSIRPYSRKLAGLKADSVKWGNIVRKLVVLDDLWETEDSTPLTAGQSVDQYVVRKPQVVETHFYGANIVQDHITIFKDQLDTAFSGPEQLGQFFSMIMQNMTDRIEQKHEEIARLTVANFIAAKTLADTGNVIYLVDEYNTATGSTETATSIKTPSVYPNFAKWLMGFLKTLSDRLTERSCKYHMNLTSKNIPRHTPLNRQKLYIYSPEMNQVDSQVLSSTFHDEYLKKIDYEPVSYWQSIDTPAEIIVTPNYIDASGAQVDANASVTVDNIFGVLFDEDALGYTTINTDVLTTPMNAAGKYTNMFFHFTDRPWMDLTENGVVLLLDENPNP